MSAIGGKPYGAPYQPGYSMTSNLLRATLELLDQTSPETWPALAKSINVTYTWLRQLDSGLIKEPGINKIERLYTALSGKSVEL